MRSLSLAILLISSLSIKNADGGLYPTYFQYYPLESCVGDFEHILWTNGNATDSSVGPNPSNAKSATSRGLFLYTLRSGVSVTSTAINFKSCTTSLDEGGYITPTNLHPFDLDDSALSLYPRGTLGGDSRTTTNEISFDSPMHFSAWAISGVEDYTAYFGTSFSGNSTCLKVNNEVKMNGYGLTVEHGFEGNTLTIGSVRRDCTGSSINTLTPMKDQKTCVFDKDGKEISDFSKVLDVKRIPELTYV